MTVRCIEATASGGDIVVIGFRASQPSATKAKKDAAVIMDAVSQDDVGRVPDLNIVEASHRFSSVIDRFVSVAAREDERFNGQSRRSARINVLRGDELRPHPRHPLRRGDALFIPPICQAAVRSFSPCAAVSRRRSIPRSLLALAILSPVRSVR